MICLWEMAKRWWTFEHPADLGLAARADSLEELFEALGEGLGRQICPGGAVRPELTRRVEVDSDELGSLAVDFLSELLRLFHLERFVIARVAVEEIVGNALRGEIDGETYDPARHELAAEVKAVTYHQLQVAREGDQWAARVILDV